MRSGRVQRGGCQGPLDNALLAELTGPFPPLARTRVVVGGRLCVVPVIRRAMHVLAGGDALGRGTWHPASPAAPAEVPTVDIPGSPPGRSCQGPDTREGRLAQWGFNQDGGRGIGETRAAPGNTLFSLPRDLCGLPVACQISPVGRERDSARSATCTTKRPNARFWIKKKQRRHGELGSSQCLSCKRSSWKPAGPLSPATVETASSWFFFFFFFFSLCVASPISLPGVWY